jgi:glutamyl-tRNA synthetase
MIRTRFAPSPTGYLHIGGVRTALYSWLYAQQHQGKFVLRIEDTDQARSTPEAVAVILEGMRWLGLEWEEGPFFQMERMARYQEVIAQLLQQGDAYYCYCSKERLDELREQQRANKQKPRYDGHCRHGAAPVVAGVAPVIRFKNPLEGSVVIDDMVKGKVVIDNRELDDLIIARGDGTPTYNLSVVVDDFDMGITHVIRGDDHLNNTPRQINLLKALGATPPRYAHVPMILGEDGARLSKRHGAVNVLNYRDAGYLPQALLNYLVRLGWSHQDQEIFSREEMIQHFAIEAVNAAPSTFNPEKLLWVNQQYLIQSAPADLAPLLAQQLEQRDITPPDMTTLITIVEAFQKRAKTLGDMADACAFIFTAPTAYDPKAASTFLTPETLPILEAAQHALFSLTDWSAATIKPIISTLCEQLACKMPQVAQPLRVAVSGNTTTPSIDLTLALVGHDASLARIDTAIAHIRQ